MEKLKLYSNLVATWVAIIGALAGGVLALVQYHNNSQAERVKVTLSYVERFNRSPLQEARSKLLAYWDTHAASARAAYEARAGKDGEKWLGDYVVRSVYEAGLTDEIALVVDFFDDLYVCTCGGLCDIKTAEQFFWRHSFEIYGLMHPYILHQRDRLNDKSNSFASGIESIFKKRITICKA